MQKRELLSKMSNCSPFMRRWQPARMTREVVHLLKGARVLRIDRTHKSLHTLIRLLWCQSRSTILRRVACAAAFALECGNCNV
jgi:hypothetical protein